LDPVAQHPSPPRRLSWAAVVALGLVFMLAAQLRIGLNASDRRIGISSTPEPEGRRVVDVVSGGPADRGGLHVDDLLVALNGQPLREANDFYRVAEGFRRGEPVAIEVIREGERLQLSFVPGMPFGWADFALNTLAFLLYLALGLLASSRQADNLRSTLLSTFCFAVAFELALPTSYAFSGGLALATNVAFYLITGLQFGLDLHLATVLPATPDWVRRHPLVVRLYYVVGLSLGGFAAVTALGAALGIAGVEPFEEVGASLINTWLLPVWAILIPSIIGRRALRFPDPRGRQQAGLVLFGVLPWVAVVLSSFVRSDLLGIETSIPEPVWNFALLAYPIAVFVAIFLYRLFDLELVVRKSLLYGALTTVLVLGFYSLVAGIGALFAREFGRQGVPLWVLSCAGLSMGLLFNPLRSRLQFLIDRRFFPERQALRSRLVALAAELPAQGKLPRMGEHLVRELARIFAVDPVAVWISTPPHGQLVQLASSRRSEADLERTALIGADDPAVQLISRSARPTPAHQLAAVSPAMAQRLAETRAELVVPLLARGHLVGLLAFGQKREDQRYVAEELELLTLVGHHVATVFENTRLFDSATYESLTGLLRREALLEILDREWSRSQRYERPLAVAIADLDRFKEINDQFGHLTGDLVLQRVAQELRSQLRETDFIGRFGGEEFLMVLPETTLAGGVQFAEKVRQRVEQLEIPTESGKTVTLTLSIGVASREGSREDTRTRSRALIAAADEALYSAKNNGRNRVEAAVAR
jgi:diguanylate cyclase (GGDEF)-like protein